MVMVLDKTTQQQLIALGKTQGYVTYDDILKQVPNAEQNLDLVEDLIEELNLAGILILQEPPAPGAIEAAPEELEEDIALPEDFEIPSDDELEDLEFLQSDLIEDAGYQQAIETDDVVGLYLKEAGRVALLTAEE